MKKIFLIILSTITIVYINSCIYENLVGINTSGSSEGSLSLKVHKISIPSEVSPGPTPKDPDPAKSISFQSEILSIEVSKYDGPSMRESSR